MSPDTYFDEFDIAMDWFYGDEETSLGQGHCGDLHDCEWFTVHACQCQCNGCTAEDENEDFEDGQEPASDEAEEDEDEEWESEEEESEGLDSFDTATGELADGFKEIPWWLVGSGKASDEETKYGVTQAMTVGSRTRFVQKFPNATQFLNYIYSEPAFLTETEKGQRYSTRDTKTAQALGLTWESARVMADRGWPEGVERVDRIARKLKRIISGAIRTPVTSYGIRGPKIDMGKFLTGDPRHMLVMSESERMKESKKPKLIRIVTTVDIASQEGFINRGAAICALAQLMQRHGIRVQIDVHVGTDDLIDTWVRVKDAERGIDIESLVFYSAHPVMFWRYAYAAWEHAPKQYRGDVGTSSMGFISEPHVDDRGDIYVSAKGSRWKDSEEQVLAWVVEQLMANGIEVELEKVIA